MRSRRQVCRSAAEIEQEAIESKETFGELRRSQQEYEDQVEAALAEERLLLGFIAASLVVLLIPGPGVLYVVARSVGQGQKAGVVSAFGLSAGALVHVGAATAGLSGILLTSATTFGVIKILGAGYLIYLGIRALLAPHSAASPSISATRSLRRVFADGIVISVLNPKIAMFFLAFLPQFVVPGHGSIPQQILFLGFLYVGLALITDSSYAVLASRLRRWSAHRAFSGPAPRYASGAVYMGLGLSMLLAERKGP